MLLRYFFKAFVFVLAFSHPCFSINIGLDPNNIAPTPNYTRLSTRVHLLGNDVGESSDYPGLSVMVVTKDLQERVAWCSKVTFKPRASDDCPERVNDGASKGGVDFLGAKAVTIAEYFTAPGYYGQDRVYFPLGTDRRGPPLSTNTRDSYTKFRHVDRISVDPNGDLKCLYKTWVKSSLFSWDCPDTHAIISLYNVIENIKQVASGKRFKYFLYGTSQGGDTLNCASFSLLLLNQLGVNIRRAPKIQDYLTPLLSWMNNDNVSFSKTRGFLSYGGALGGAILGGAAAAATIGSGGLLLPVVGAVAASAGGYSAYKVGNGVCNVGGNASPKHFVEEIKENTTALTANVVSVSTPAGLAGNRARAYHLYDYLGIRTPVIPPANNLNFNFRY